MAKLKRYIRTDIRILLEMKNLIDDPLPDGITVLQDETNSNLFYATITGPEDTPYSGGIFKLELFLPEDYPIVAPKVRFITKVFHPNIDRLGRICVDILDNKWSPALEIRTVLLSVQSLLSSPNPNDGLNIDASLLWINNEAGAIEKAKEWTKEYATK